MVALRGALTTEEKQKLEALFARVPQLRRRYEFRLRFQKIFDTAKGRRQAYRALLDLFLDMLDFSGELDGFIRTFERWQDEILNYFEARQTSGPVEGLNNKARVILKRSYGLKGADSLWTRLVPVYRLERMVKCGAVRSDRFPEETNA